MNKNIVIGNIIILLVFLSLFGYSSEDKSSFLDKKLEKGEAFIWYLGHSGWAVKTQSHFLVFDYCETGTRPSDPGLKNGYINTEDIKDQNIYIFVTHAHRDHYDERVLEWEKKIPGITYVWGWPEDRGKNSISMEQKRETKEIDGMKVYTICHQFDGIPESAFLIDVDGVIIVHSGDHGNGPPPLKKEYTDNIDYLAGLSSEIDILFLPCWGEEFYPIQSLNPKITFPMHEGGREHTYEKWAKVAVDKYKNTQIAYARARGDCFLYKHRKISKLE